MTTIARKHIEVRGTVQGVGFRPFVHRLAQRHHLSGWVLNRSGGVEIEVEGPSDRLAALLRDLQAEAPPLARIEGIAVRDAPPLLQPGFEIRASVTSAGEVQRVPPDTATCPDCLRELLDPADRRYRYPFINCTNCGPRFTVIEGLPYDRPLTTMRVFPMCAQCEREYHDPADRRFHAQPNACPACGPHVWLATPSCASGRNNGEGAQEEAVELLRDGKILAIKALGGFHLACDARNETAVQRLRERKRRPTKPFAVMFPDLQSIGQVSPAEADLLTSPRRPIVLLAPGSRPLAPSVAPRLQELGAMLPSTPLHHLLLTGFGGPLVMTSGNLSEEPIAAGNDEALERLAGIADAFLLHDRDIASRYDDSVTRVFAGAPALVRRARGYAPEPLRLPVAASKPLLACGAHLKSTFCLVRGQHALVSQHIGDLENLETLEHFRRTLDLYQRLFEIRPEVLAHDLHPEYLSTKFAHSLQGLERVGVQHHHAHLVSCLAEHGLRGPAIGVAYDGLGYGADGHLWGGEFMVFDERGFERRAHLREAPMPGGEAAIHKPYRMAAGYLLSWLPNELELFAPFLETVPELPLLGRGINAPPTSSCGRLFDAVSALLGICREARYEGQAAMELQAAADPSADGVYPYEIKPYEIRPYEIRSSGIGGQEPAAGSRAAGGSGGSAPLIVDPAPALLALYTDYRQGVPVSTVAMRFHRTVAQWTAETVGRLRAETGLETTVVGGGVFQNTLLLGQVLERLDNVRYPRRLPANDGGISYGQAVVALSLTNRDG